MFHVYLWLTVALKMVESSIADILNANIWKYRGLLPEKSTYSYSSSMICYVKFSGICNGDKYILFILIIFSSRITVGLETKYL